MIVLLLMSSCLFAYGISRRGKREIWTKCDAAVAEYGRSGGWWSRQVVVPTHGRGRSLLRVVAHRARGWGSVHRRSADELPLDA